jgi:hypothetical protein
MSLGLLGVPCMIICQVVVSMSNHVMIIVMSQCPPSLELTKNLTEVVIGCFKHHLNCGQEIIFSFENGLFDEVTVYFRCSHRFTVFRNIT